MTRRHGKRSLLLSGLAVVALIGASLSATGQVLNDPPTVTIEQPSDGATVAGELNVTGTASDSDGSVESVAVSIDEGPFDPANGTSSWFLLLDTTSLAEGNHTITARAFDGEDHSETTTINITVDNQPEGEQGPTVTVESPQEGASVTAGDALNITGTASAPEATVDTVEVRIDAGSWLAANGTTSWTYTWETTEVAAGEHTIQARAVADGNESELDTVNITVEADADPPQEEPANQAPEVTITTPEEGATVEATFNATGTATDADGEVDFVELRIDQGPWKTATGTTTWEASLDATDLAAGEHTLKARAMDEAGTTSITQVSITLAGNDTNQAPNVTIDQPSPGQQLSGEITLTGTAEDPDGQVVLVEARIDQGPWEPATGTPTWSFSWNTSLETQGEHVVSVRAIDDDDATELTSRTYLVQDKATGQDAKASGNGTDEQLETSAVQPDPEIEILQPAPGTQASGVLHVEGQVTVPQGAIETVEVRVDGGPWQQVTAGADGSFATNLDVSGLEGGSHVLTVRATTGAGELETQSQQFTVQGGLEVPGLSPLLLVGLLALAGITAHRRT